MAQAVRRKDIVATRRRRAAIRNVIVTVLEFAMGAAVLVGILSAGFLLQAFAP